MFPGDQGLACMCLCPFSLEGVGIENPELSKFVAVGFAFFKLGKKTGAVPLSAALSEVGHTDVWEGTWGRPDPGLVGREAVTDTQQLVLLY